MTLVETLRMAGRHAPIDENVFDQAADEIERLRAHIQEQLADMMARRMEIERLQAELATAKRDSAAAWDKCEMRRKETEMLAAELDEERRHKLIGAAVLAKVERLEREIAALKHSSLGETE